MVDNVNHLVHCKNKLINFLLSVYNVILKKFYLNVKLKISLIIIPKINYCSCIKDDNNYDLDYNTFDS